MLNAVGLDNYWNINRLSVGKGSFQHLHQTYDGTTAQSSIFFVTTISVWNGLYMIINVNHSSELNNLKNHLI